jgi:hypothetical protein
MMYLQVLIATGQYSIYLNDKMSCDTNVIRLLFPGDSVAVT